MSRKHDKKRYELNGFQKLLLIVLLFVMCICTITSIISVHGRIKKQKSVDGKTVKIDSVVNEVDVPDDVTFTLAVIGDIMCHNTQYTDAQNADGSYDFSYVFDDIKDELSAADYTVGNLETTFAGRERGYSSYPEFNSPETLGDAIKEAGIDLVCTANNHSLDTRYSGIESTIDYLDQIGLVHTGTYKSQEAQDTTTIVDIKGLKVAFLAFTYGTNGIPVQEGREYCINLISDDFIVDRINLAKEQNPDIIICFMHWGEEYQLTPNEEQQHLASLLFLNGVDIILGSHPHVLQTMELNRKENESDDFVIYSLGNFVSGQVKENTRDSIILNLQITKKGTGEVKIDYAKYTPIYTYKSGASSRQYKVLNIRKALEAYDNGQGYISAGDYNVLTTELQKIYNQVGNEY